MRWVVLSRRCSGLGLSDAGGNRTRVVPGVKIPLPLASRATAPSGGWSHSGSNRKSSPCKGGALPITPWPRGVVVDGDGVEPPQPERPVYSGVSSANTQSIHVGRSPAEHAAPLRFLRPDGRYGQSPCGMLKASACPNKSGRFHALRRRKTVQVWFARDFPNFSGPKARRD